MHALVLLLLALGCGPGDDLDCPEPYRSDEDAQPTWDALGADVDAGGHLTDAGCQAICEEFVPYRGIEEVYGCALKDGAETVPTDTGGSPPIVSCDVLSGPLCA